MWPNNCLIELLNIDLPIIQAPMASAGGSALAAALGREIGASDLTRTLAAEALDHVVYLSEKS